MRMLRTLAFSQTIYRTRKVEFRDWTRAVRSNYVVFLWNTLLRCARDPCAEVSQCDCQCLIPQPTPLRSGSVISPAFNICLPSRRTEDKIEGLRKGFNQSPLCLFFQLWSCIQFLSRDFQDSLTQQKLTFTATLRTRSGATYPTESTFPLISSKT